jgi:hypothetical protein
MATINHIFVYVVLRPDDPFLGIKELLSRERLGRHNIIDIRLPPSSYKIVQRVEYSWRKYARFRYYASVFRRLEDLLCQALSGCESGHPCVIYFSDEGVWAEFFREFRSRRPHSALLGVNVQHGFERRVRIEHRNLRRVANWLSIKSLGFPAFGMGCFGGVGTGVFQVYLTYDKAASDFVRENTGDLAYECPSVIKHALLDRFKMAKQLRSDKCRDSQDVLFALQPHIDNIKGNTLSMFRELTSVARLLVERYGRRMVFRTHPGTQHDRVMNHYRQSHIDRYAGIDRLLDLADQLARCGVVMSYDSTVLWEAYILGLVPVSVHGDCYQGELSFPHEILNVKSNLEAQLDNVLCPETAQRYRSQPMTQEFNWEEIVLSLFTEASAGGNHFGDSRTMKRFHQSAHLVCDQTGSSGKALP